MRDFELEQSLALLRFWSLMNPLAIICSTVMQCWEQSEEIVADSLAMEHAAVHSPPTVQGNS